jgi:PST family polysaccharide transporter
VFSSAVNKVTLPIFGRVREDREELATHLSSAVAAICACAFPVSAICAGLAHPLIEAVYGPRWDAAAPALYGLSVLAAATVVGTLFIDALFALGRSYFLLTTQVVSVVLLIPGIYLGVRIDGIAGAAWANAFILGGVVLVLYVYAVRARGIKVGWLPRVAALPLLGSLAAGVTAHLTATLVSNAALACLAGTAAAVAVYLLICGVWLRKTAVQLRQLYGKRVDDTVAEQVASPDTGTDAAVGMTPA